MILNAIGIYVIVCTGLGIFWVRHKGSSQKSSERQKYRWPDGRPVLDYIHGPDLLSASRSWNLTSECPMDVLIGEYGMVSILSEGQVISQETLVDAPFTAIRDFEAVEDE